MRVAFEQWVDETNQESLRQLIGESLTQLRAVAAAETSPARTNTRS
jgi:hypothetical protein